MGLNKINLDPEDIHIQLLNEVAITTFHLKGYGLSRRTIVFRKTKGNWMIEHLHASNSLPKET